MRKILSGSLLVGALTLGALAPALIPATANAASAPVQTPSVSPSARVDVVLDHAGLFTPAQEQRITDAFAQDTSRYGILPVVEVVKDLGGDSAERYAIRRANELGIGDSDEDNGLYVLISMKEHALRVEPGLGLHRVVDESTIQGVVDNTMIPEFKNDNQTGGVISGVQEIGEASLQKPASSDVIDGGTSYDSGSDFDPNWGLVGGIFGGIVGAAALTGGTVFYFRRKAEKARAAEVARKRSVADDVQELTEAVYAAGPKLNAYASLPNREARFDWFVNELRYTDFKPGVYEKAEHFDKFDQMASGRFINYRGLGREFFGVRRSEDESFEDYQERVDAELPNAQAAKADADRREAEAREARRLYELRRDAAKAEWKKIGKLQRETYAMASSRERESIGDSYFDDYSNSERRGFFNGFGDSLKTTLESEAKQKFKSLPRSQRERIARASGSTRDRYIQEYIPGYNPLMIGIYAGAATSFYSSLQADEARAAAASSSSSSSSYGGTSSFGGGFSSSDTYSGGSFDGGGGGGSW